MKITIEAEEGETMQTIVWTGVVDWVVVGNANSDPMMRESETVSFSGEYVKHNRAWSILGLLDFFRDDIKGKAKIALSIANRQRRRLVESRARQLKKVKAVGISS